MCCTLLDFDTVRYWSLISTFQDKKLLPLTVSRKCMDSRVWGACKACGRSYVITWRVEEGLDTRNYNLEAQYFNNNRSETFKYSLNFMPKFKLWSLMSKGWSEYNTTFVTWHGRLPTLRSVQITHLTPQHSEFYCVGNNDGSWARDEVVEKLGRTAQTVRLLVEVSLKEENRSKYY